MTSAALPLYFGYVILYPFISAMVTRFVFRASTSILKTLKNDFYLWAAFTLGWVGVNIMLFAFLRLVFSDLIAFIIYTIAYFLLSVVRKIKTNTISGDIFANPPPNLKG
jgi:hypothetical protein